MYIGARYRLASQSGLFTYQAFRWCHQK